MSYTIFYRAMFVRLSDGTLIPMIESGDNNVWECDNRRRAREWCSCRWLHESQEQRSRYSLTEKEILDAAQHEIDKTLESYVGREPAFGGKPYTREFILGDLGFFNSIKVSGSSVTSATRFLNFIKSGIRNAVSMDELNGSLRLSWYEDGVRRSADASDENELSEKWAKCQSLGITPYVCMRDHVAEYAWRSVKARNPRTPRNKKEHTEFFVIAFTYGSSDRYVVKLTSRNLKFNPFREYAYKYSSLKLAEDACRRISSRFAQLSNIRVEKVSA